jgi:hypothetical protein
MQCQKIPHNLLKLKKKGLAEYLPFHSESTLPDWQTDWLPFEIHCKPDKEIEKGRRSVLPEYSAHSRSTHRQERYFSVQITLGQKIVVSLGHLNRFRFIIAANAIKRHKSVAVDQVHPAHTSYPKPKLLSIAS